MCPSSVICVCYELLTGVIFTELPSFVSLEIVKSSKDVQKYNYFTHFFWNAQLIWIFFFTVTNVFILRAQ